MNRWPDSEVVGLDNSTAIIEKARHDHPEQKWIVDSADNIDPDFYYDILNKFATRVELWETSYFHILNSQGYLIDFIRTTGLKPYLDRLPSDEMRYGFEEEVLKQCKKYYKVQSDGNVLFPFDIYKLSWS